MARFAKLSESELSTVLEEKDAENTKKVTKVTLNIFRGYLLEKGLREAELTSKIKAESNEDESWWELTVPNCHRGHLKLHNENIKEWLLWLCFYFNKIYDCLEKASSTAAKQDRMTANSHQQCSAKYSKFLLK